MGSEHRDPLEQLVVDREDIDRERLAEGIRELVGIDAQTGAPVFHPKYNRLTAKQKILALMLSRKAAALMAMVEEESAAPKEVGSASGIPDGTVRRSLKELLDERLLSKTTEGRYVCASHQLIQAVEFLKP